MAVKDGWQGGQAQLEIGSKSQKSAARPMPIKEVNLMKKFAIVAFASAAALALSACGSSDSAQEEATPDNVEMPAEEAVTDVDAPVADASAAADAGAAATDAAAAEVAPAPKQ